jgi:hypothetical protein
VHYQMETVNENIKALHLPSELSSRIRHYYEYLWEAHHMVREKLFVVGWVLVWVYGNICRGISFCAIVPAVLDVVQCSLGCLLYRLTSVILWTVCRRR